MDIDSAMGLPRDGAAHHIGYSQHLHPFFFCLSQSSQGVSCLARLADGDDQVTLAQHGLTVPEFRRVFNINGNPGIFLYKVFTDKARVP